MLTSPPPGKAAYPLSTTGRPDENSTDLRFISDLGRSLLFSVHPKKVAERVAEALASGTGAAACLVAAEIESIGLISCAYSADGPITADFLDRSRFDKWLELLPPQVSYSETDPDRFLVACGTHSVEYIAPLHINGEIKGAVVVAFDEADDLTERSARLVDAATQMTAMSVNLSAHYEAAIDSSINEAREEHRKFTEAVLDALPVSLYVVDRNYRIVTWNRRREEGSQGIPRYAAIGRDVFDVLERYPEGRLREEFERAFRTGRIERIEQQTIADDGTTQHWLVSKVPMTRAGTDEVTHVITVGEDVTMRVEAVQAVNRADKLAAVGRLAAGVVHEINNPLATIAACAEALEQRIDEGAFQQSDAADDLAEYLGLIKSEAFRCKTITTGLLDFSRLRTGHRTSVDLGDVVRSAANLISHQNRGDRLTIRTKIAAELPQVHADAGQIQQAVIALATNAIDAMPDGGTLTFRVLTRSSRVVIEVEDTGVGIPAEDVSKIFEPFFTTKEVGKGTGLGLAVCYGIISEHGGRLTVRSRSGKGTIFGIFLPAIQNK
jgi:two-component system NtrC family sensor kinase